MECKLRHPIVVYMPTAVRVAHELTRTHQLARQLTLTSSLQTHTCEERKVTYIASRRDQ